MKTITNSENQSTTAPRVHFLQTAVAGITRRMASARALCLSMSLAVTVIATPLVSAGAAWEIEDIFSLDTPFAVGHRGYGVNLGEDPDRPIENTRDSVKQAYQDGLSMVEIDVQITSDGKVVAFHDDFLSDFSCVNAMTFKELKQRLGEVSLLKTVLNTARSYRHRQQGPSGLVIVELKAPAPLCDPDDSTEFDYVSTVIEVIRERDMEDQVILQSFSPTLLKIALKIAPEIERQLAASIIQFLSPEQVEAVTGLPVEIIGKNDFGLQWAEIGPLFRLPGYQDLVQFIGVSLEVGSRGVVLDALILFQAEDLHPGGASLVVGTLHMLGLPVMTYTLNTPGEWLAVTSWGVDGIITDDIPLGLMLQGY
jgi:glycerophosphoryl diester phosphodiesterase